MNEFNAGDEIWWFEGPDQNLIHDLECLQLLNGIYLGIEDETYYFSKDKSGYKHGLWKGNAYFKSKKEATEGLIEYLNKL
jgi:hypothetical protein